MVQQYQTDLSFIQRCLREAGRYRPHLWWLWGTGRRQPLWDWPRLRPCLDQTVQCNPEGRADDH
ncbi:MAG TPA: hypothetical protein EYP56_03185 [Planctomycetaceae bacterium]|nr:hypothetical protein [Planctomycetaceae bacterium]